MSAVDLQQHQLSANYPPMPEADFAEFVEDIRKHGQITPGLVYEGQVLDGWHRYLACRKAGVPFKCLEYKGDDPVACVESLNKFRRHMTASQAAATVVANNKWRSARSGRGAPGASLSNQQLAEQAGVSVRTIQQAKLAEKAGLGDKVRSGEMSVKEAASKARRDAPGAPPKPTPKKADRTKELEEENASLREQLDDLQTSSAALLAKVEAAEAVLAGEHAQMIVALKDQLRTVERSRDHYMNESAELKKQIKRLERKAGMK